MKFSLTSFSLLFIAFLYSFIAEALALPVVLPEGSDLQSRAPTSGYDKFLAWLKTPPGNVYTNICFWSGNTGGLSVATALPTLVTKTGCEYTGSLLSRAGIPQADSDAFTLTQWATISRQLATNARGKAKALLGDTMRPDAIWTVDELPILRESIKKGLVSGIDLWKMDAKGSLSGPTPYA